MTPSTAQWKGHSEPETTLLRAFQARRLHHGWLLAGPEGIGKRSFALAAAAQAMELAGEVGVDPSRFGTIFATGEFRIRDLEKKESIELMLPVTAGEKRRPATVTL